MSRTARALLVVSLLSLAGCGQPPGQADGGTGGGAAGGGSTGGGGGGGGSDAGSDAGVRPLKVFFAFEASQSLAVTDPAGSRAAALRQALDALPPTTEVMVMASSGSAFGYLTAALPEFVPLSQLSPADRAQLTTRLLSFTPPGGGSNSSDWVAVMSEIYARVYSDTQEVLIAGEPKADYSVVFVTDGRPTNNQDDVLLCGDMVSRIHQLRLYAGEVRLHTVHVFLPAQAPTCGVDAGLSVFSTQCLVPQTVFPGCASLEVELDAERLRRMALLGAGQFLDFRSGGVSFSSLFP